MKKRISQLESCTRTIYTEKFLQEIENSPQISLFMNKKLSMGRNFKVGCQKYKDFYI